MRRIWIALICLLVSAFPLSGQVREVFKVPYPERYQAVNDFVEAGKTPERDLSRIAALMAVAIDRGNGKDLRNVQRAELVVKHMWGLDTATFSLRASKLMEAAVENHDYAAIGFAYETLGDQCYTRGEYAKTFEYYLRAYEYYHNSHKSEFPDMAETQMKLASGYFRFGDYTNALRYSKEVVTHHDPKRPWITILLHDLVGSSYLAMNMSDSAIAYFRKIFEYAPLYHTDEGRIIWQGVANGKVGLALFQKKRAAEAVPHLERGIELCSSRSDGANVATFSLCLYKIFLVQNDKLRADHYLDVARAAVHSAGNLECYIDYYDLMSKHKRRGNDAAAALRYIDSLALVRDSLSVIVNVNKKYVAELDVVREQRLASEQAATQERARLVATRNAFIAVVLILMLLTLFLYNRSLLKQKLHKHELLAEKQLSEAELRNAGILLETIRKNLNEKNEMLAQIEADKGVVEDSALIDRLRESTILTDEQWEEFRKLFEKTHPGFLQQLKLKYPELSPSETRFMVLAKLNYSNKDMAATLGVSSQAVRTTWYRIRKKIGLPEESTLEELLQQV